MCYLKAECEGNLDRKGRMGKGGREVCEKRADF